MATPTSPIPITMILEALRDGRIDTSRSGFDLYGGLLHMISRTQQPNETFEWRGSKDAVDGSGTVPQPTTLTMTHRLVRGTVRWR